MMPKVPAVGADDGEVGGEACADVYDVALATLTSMGFEEEKCVLALQAQKNDVERAVSGLALPEPLFLAWLLRSREEAAQEAADAALALIMQQDDRVRLRPAPAAAAAASVKNKKRPLLPPPAISTQCRP